MIVILAVSAVISRKIYRATNNPYIGGFINAAVVTLISVSNTLTVSLLTGGIEVSEEIEDSEDGCRAMALSNPISSEIRRPCEDPLPGHAGVPLGRVACSRQRSCRRPALIQAGEEAAEETRLRCLRDIDGGLRCFEAAFRALDDGESLVPVGHHGIAAMAVPRSCARPLRVEFILAEKLTRLERLTFRRSA